MRIGSIRIENLRAFKDETLNLDNYACLVGPNGSGKSTVLCALSIFFRDTANSSTDVTCLQAEDFHQRDTSRPIRITVTFVELDEDAQRDFADYFRQGELVVAATASFDSMVILVQNGPTLGQKCLSKTGPASASSCKLVHLSGDRTTGGGGWSRWTSMHAFGGLIWSRS